MIPLSAAPTFPASQGFGLPQRPAFYASPFFSRFGRCGMTAVLFRSNPRSAAVQPFRLAAVQKIPGRKTFFVFFSFNEIRGCWLFVRVGRLTRGRPDPGK